MLTFRNVRLNVENLYQYLKTNLKEIESIAVSKESNRIKSITGLHKIANRVVITAEQAEKHGNCLREIEILSIDCDSVDLYSQMFSNDSIFLGKSICVKVQDLLDAEVFDTDNLVYAVSGDVSTQSWSAEFVLFGVFRDFDKARKVAKEDLYSINAFYLDKETSVYIGGYME